MSPLYDSCQKVMLFEGGHRVPFIVRWPNGIKGKLNRSDSRHITLENFIATCAEILAIESPEHAVDSVRFSPQLQNREPYTKYPKTIFSSLGNYFIARVKDSLGEILANTLFCKSSTLS